MKSVTGAVALMGVAGCSGDDGDGTDTATATDTETATPTETPTPTATPTPSPAQEHYDEAISNLVDNRETLEAWASGEENRDEQTLVTLQDRLTSAEESLDQAEETADADLEERIVQARNVAALQGEILLLYEDAFEFDQKRADAQAFEETEQHERAASTYQEAIDVIDQLRNRIDDIETAYERVEQEGIDEPDLEVSGSFFDLLELGSRADLDPFESLMSGSMRISRAIVRSEEGFTEWENEAWAAARDKWTESRDLLQQARSDFEDVQDSDLAPDDIRQQAIIGIGFTDDLEEAADLYIQATREAEDGNLEEANSLIQDGLAVIGEE